VSSIANGDYYGKPVIDLVLFECPAMMYAAVEYSAAL
jgi:hypothetical protein